MEFRSLKYLLSLSERGSFTAAAKDHYVTQPAVSIQLRKLQDELGTVLFEVRGRDVHFTRAGEIVLEYARRFSELDGEMHRKLADLEELRSGRIALGTIDAASIYVLPDVYSHFQRHYPGIDIHIEIAATVPLLRKLREGEIDCLVGTLPVEESDDLEVFPIYDESLVVIAPPGHPLARRRRLTAGDLARHAFISFREESITRRIIERVLVGKGVTPKISMAIDSPEAIKNLVSSGIGLAILPERAVRDEIADGRVVPLRITGLAFTRTLGLIVPARRYLSRPVRAFLGVLGELLDVQLPRRLVEHESEYHAVEMVRQGDSRGTGRKNKTGMESSRSKQSRGKIR
ncbi:MAG TPA: LysR family transcriptional regulator [Patescibacteria group bacterium]|nr:LysR family transcriptional regulator [Patescibacteria group bacterium]